MPLNGLQATDPNVEYQSKFVVHASGDIEVHNSIEFIESFPPTKPKSTTPKTRIRYNKDGSLFTQPPSLPHRVSELGTVANVFFIGGMVLDPTHVTAA
jgi:hypothetical protein